MSAIAANQIRADAKRIAAKLNEQGSGPEGLGWILNGIDIQGAEPADAPVIWWSKPRFLPPTIKRTTIPVLETDIWNVIKDVGWTEPIGELGSQLVALGSTALTADGELVQYESVDDIVDLDLPGERERRYAASNQTLSSGLPRKGYRWDMSRLHKLPGRTPVKLTRLSTDFDLASKYRIESFGGSPEKVVEYWQGKLVELL